MANHLFLLGTLGAIGWVFLNGPPPVKPAERPPPARVVTTDISAPSHASASRPPGTETHRDPVPLVRNVPPSAKPPVASASNATPVAVEEQPAQDDLDRKAAKAAVELDGYKRVSIVGKASNGAWRARGYRGTTEVLLTVDGTGRVSTE